MCKVGQFQLPRKSSSTPKLSATPGVHDNHNAQQNCGQTRKNPSQIEFHWTERTFSPGHTSQHSWQNITFLNFTCFARNTYAIFCGDELRPAHFYLWTTASCFIQENVYFIGTNGNRSCIGNTKWDGSFSSLSGNCYWRAILKKNIVLSSSHPSADCWTNSTWHLLPMQKNRYGKATTDKCKDCSFSDKRTRVTLDPAPCSGHRGTCRDTEVR